jgi:hypothetical protein
MLPPMVPLPQRRSEAFYVLLAILKKRATTSGTFQRKQGKIYTECLAVIWADFESVFYRRFELKKKSYERQYFISLSLSF